MEDLKSKLAIQKTEPHERNKDMQALIAQIGQWKLGQDGAMWDLRRGGSWRENININTWAVLIFLTYNSLERQDYI